MQNIVSFIGLLCKRDLCWVAMAYSDIVCTLTDTPTKLNMSHYGVATISRLLKNYRSLSQNIVAFIGLFCKRDICLRESTNRSHLYIDNLMDNIYILTYATYNLFTRMKTSYDPDHMMRIAEYSLFRRALLQKRPIFLGACSFIGLFCSFLTSSP